MANVLDMALDDVIKQKGGSTSDSRGRGRRNGYRGSRNSMDVESSGPRRSYGSRRFKRRARSLPYSRPPKGNPDAPWKHDLFQDEQSDFRGRRGGARSVGQAGSGKLLVSNLHYEIMEDELQGIFEEFGDIAKAFIKFDNSGRSTGEAVVIFENDSDARTALAEMNGANVNGQTITVTSSGQEVASGAGRLFKRSLGEVNASSGGSVRGRGPKTFKGRGTPHWDMTTR